MSDKTIEERCNFNTLRLSVSSWTNQIKKEDTKKNFAEKVIEILTPNVTKALPDGWQNISTMDAAQAWINERSKESNFLTIQLLATNEIVGFIFLYELDSENKFYQLRFGYLFSEKKWGKGFGTELMKGLIKWCKTEGNIKSISGGVETDNIGSIKVMEKCGFHSLGQQEKSGNVIFYERIITA